MRVVSISIAALMTIGGIVFITTRAPRDARNNNDGDRLAAMEQELDGMRRQVASAESARGAALGRALVSGETKPARSAPDAPAPPEPQASAVAQPPTSEEAVRTFKTYFQQLDELRGSNDDVALTNQFATALSTDEWKEGTPGSPSKKAISCGNGYCRIALTFKESKDAEAARMRLMTSLRDVAGRMSIFLDPDTLRVEAYCATGDKVFPAFPG